MMSGEAVLIPIIAMNPIAAGVAIATTLVIEIAEARYQQAATEAKQRQKVVYQQQQTNAAVLSDLHQSLFKEVQQFTLSQSAEQLSARNTQIQASGFMQPSEKALRRQWQIRLRALQKKLSAIAEIYSSPAMLRLQQQATDWLERLQNDAMPLAETLESFQQTVQRTITQHLNVLEQQQAQHQACLAEAEKLLDKLLIYQRLAEDSEYEPTLAALLYQLTEAMQNNVLNQPLLNTVQRQFQALEPHVNKVREQAAAYDALHGIVTQYLRKQGYTHLGEQHTRSGVMTTWQVPGGEQVQIRLQPDFQLVCQMLHERDGKWGDNALSNEEKVFYQQQENHWCKDMRGLLHFLVQSGFAYELSLERKQDVSQTIPIAVVESMQDILDNTERRGRRETRQRYLD